MSLKSEFFMKMTSGGAYRFSSSKGTEKKGQRNQNPDFTELSPHSNKQMKISEIQKIKK